MDAATPPRTIEKGCVVVINYLPQDITIRDILPRVRGGGVANITLSQMGTLKMATITFKEASSAALYNAACHKLGHSIWAFKPNDSAPAPRKTQFAEVVYCTKLNGELDNDPSISALEPKLALPDGIELVWKAFDFPKLLRTPHYRDQIEDVWMDSPEEDATGRVTFVNLHIWFTSISIALGAQFTAYCKHSRNNDSHEWFNFLRFETDPCEADESTLMSHDGPSSVFAWHSYPQTSLLSLNDLGQLDKLFMAWQSVLHPIAAKTPSAMADESKDITNTGPKLTKLEARLMQLLREGQQRISEKYFAGPVNGNSNFSRHLGRRAAHNNQYSGHRYGYVGSPDCQTPSATSYLAALSDFSLLVAKTSPYCRGPLVSPALPLENLLTASSATSNETDDAADKEDNVALPDQDLKDLVTTQKTYPDYSRENWEAGIRHSASWSVSMDEFCAMSDEQWKAFGTIFYIAPKGFNTSKRHDSGGKRSFLDE
ncbi:hypothetical protein M406DRAFT_72736 [Cryphonectria parasitica EP155]|uniref:Uncharacterized protein n=1 Tax=Cryphonectria parasitica (strain ATCC 38755 / EP155) TaxID=660469 RepID=A0A9P5CM01_CRYP1|nr:uncharacterized protein M406DRAFT_72736 [Cryphonectria parasitica EP155]KAF3762752.1 hypothetical protein M406DRAFT_72736 [Cryphonectria parasitica EP155]